MTVETVSKPSPYGQSRPANRPDAMGLGIGIDGRGRRARRWRDICRELLATLPEPVSPIAVTIVRRVATLTVSLEAAEGLLAANDGSFDLAVYNSGCNNLRRLLADLAPHLKAAPLPADLDTLMGGFHSPGEEALE